MTIMPNTRFCRKVFSVFKIPSCNNSTKIINLKTMNQQIIEMEYAVRGPVSQLAEDLKKELAEGKKKPFTKVVKANLGDAHAMGQKPITFFRQVLALVSYPELLKSDIFPSDTKQRAQQLIESCRGQSVGSYSDSMGIESIRKHVAEFIERRDGAPSKAEDIMLSSGASEAINSVIKLMNQKQDGKVTGLMVPIPQYPLYSAKIVEQGMALIGYYLDECNNWGLDLQELQRSFDEGKNQCCLKGIVVINPGNPTGQVLNKESLEGVVRFAHKNKLVLLADEVYQQNIWAEGSEFHSIKKIINAMGEPYCSMELASFMSCSKGYMGECGLRGGYCELVNFCPEVMANFSKCISSMLCPTVLGQCLMDCVVKPPVEGEPSYELYCCEKDDILKSLKTKAQMAYEFFNNAEGFSCNEVQGAMYAFPQIEIPAKAIEEAKKKNLDPNTYYVIQLLEQTGICMIAGSGFKQKPGTFHIRTTILPSVEELGKVLELMKNFQENFLKKYR